MNKSNLKNEEITIYLKKEIQSNIVKKFRYFRAGFRHMIAKFAYLTSKLNNPIKKIKKHFYNSKKLNKGTNNEIVRAI